VGGEDLTFGSGRRIVPCQGLTLLPFFYLLSSCKGFKLNSAYESKNTQKIVQIDSPESEDIGDQNNEDMELLKLDFKDAFINRSTYCKKVLAAHDYDENAGPAACTAIYKKVVENLKETIRSQSGNLFVKKIDPVSGKIKKNGQLYTSIKRQFEILTSAGRSENLSIQSTNSLNSKDDQTKLNTKTAYDTISTPYSSLSQPELVKLWQENKIKIQKLIVENKRLEREIAKYTTEGKEEKIIERSKFDKTNSKQSNIGYNAAVKSIENNNAVYQPDQEYKLRATQTNQHPESIFFDDDIKI
jgi:hypothetical protein